VSLRPIDFEWLSQSVEIIDVLDLIGWEWTSEVGGQYRGPCPLHVSRSPRSRVFSVSTDLNLFHCFKCRAHGGILDLWSQAKGITKLESAYDLCAIFAREPVYLERWQK